MAVHHQDESNYVESELKLIRRVQPNKLTLILCFVFWVRRVSRAGEMPAGGENFLDWSPQEAYCYHILPRNVGVISHIILDMHVVILLNGNDSHRLGNILIIEYSIKTRLLVSQHWWGPGPLWEHEIEIKCKSIHLLARPGGKPFTLKYFL